MTEEIKQTYKDMALVFPKGCEERDDPFIDEMCSRCAAALALEEMDELYAEGIIG
jgi:hypothetical protein